MIEKAIKIQQLFENRLVLVGSVVDEYYFGSNLTDRSDLDFTFRAEDTKFIKTKIKQLKLDFKEYLGMFCGRKYAGRVDGVWVDFFMTYPFSNQVDRCYNGLLCQDIGDRWDMVMNLYTSTSDTRWANKCKSKFRELINSGGFRLCYQN